jgi:hypothetical protein
VIALPKLSGALALTCALLPGGAALAAITFEDLLDEGALTYVEPEGFTEVRPGTNPLLPFERAMRAADESLEIRYVIRPVARAKVEYDDPHNAAPDPNHLYAMMFRALLDELADGGNAPLREYPPEQALEKFNADWAAAAVFDVDRRFSDTFHQALLIAMHKDQRADAYMIFLFDDYARAKSAIRRNMRTLRFR